MFAEIRNVANLRDRVFIERRVKRSKSKGASVTLPWTGKPDFSTLNGCGSYGRPLGISACCPVGMDDAVNYRELARELVGDRSKWP
jgi:hypothetical protein